MRELFNDGWSFAKMPVENIVVKEGEPPVLFTPDEFWGKEPADFTPVQIPHDWLIYDTKNLYEDSVGFYRKTFSLASVSERHFYLNFGAVYMNWAVWVNGKKACEWKYGYTTVEFEITPFVHEGENEVELIAVYQSPNTRWYSGAGIFRDVNLVTTGKTRIVNDGIYFAARPEVDGDFNGKWVVLIQIEVSGDFAESEVRHKILSPSGDPVLFVDSKQTSQISKTLAPAMGTCFSPDQMILLDSFSALVDKPILWDDENPAVYMLRTEVLVDGKVVDVAERQVGFKDVKFDSDKGMFVNGRHVKLNGVCEHHDLGLLGSAFDIVALERQFVKLKEMGVNAIRTSHNPQDTEFLNLADRMGFYIDSEFFDMWEKPKTTYDYGNYFAEWHERDAAAQLRRDRNHPSLIMWSIGNEIYDTHSGNGLRITRDLKSICRRYDPEKNAAVTIGSNYMEWDGAQNCAEETDVVGYNYLERLYEGHHKNHPAWCIYGSETSSTVQSRGIYHFPLSNRLLTCVDNQCSTLGNCSTNWGAKNSSVVVTNDRDAPYSSGQFIWTGWDYIGEPTPYQTKNSFFGQIDTAGFEKDTFYVYKSAWNKKSSPFVHILPYWDFNVGQLIDVRVHSNVENVELFLNGTSLGRKKIDLENGLEIGATWEKIPYAPGEILALGYDSDGKEIARDEQKSFGDSKSLCMSVEPVSKNGLYFIDISSVDKNGFPVANSRSRVEISLTGDAVLLGADNGDSTDYEQYRSVDGKTISRKLFGNRLLAMVRAKNDGCDFTVTAASFGLNCAALVFKNGKVDEKASKESSGMELEVENHEVPVRKIELTCGEGGSLDAVRRSVRVSAKILPENASDREILWQPMMLEGVRSDCADLKIEKTASGEIAEVTGVSDGSFRLTCTAANRSPYREIISELEFSVSGIGRATRSPYTLIEACKCSSSSKPVMLSFKGGAFTQKERSWFSFDKLDFGSDGADTFSVPIFSFDNALDFELWDGNPDDGKGVKLMDCHYEAPSIYNTYQARTYTLLRRLFGVHELSLVFTTGLSVQGIVFEKSPKAYAKLMAADCASVVGDSFTRSGDSIDGIGNNVVLEFDAMDFGDKAPSKITVCGFSHVDNTIHVKFLGENGNDVNRILEYPKGAGCEERTFQIEGVCGKCRVAFVFLPGSKFDFKWFRFE